ncbi:hypothetical protein J2Y74_000536 [Pseudomonas migulae]|nr:hypothetical protein [Pseudomonas migulae]
MLARSSAKIGAVFVGARLAREGGIAFSINVECYDPFAGKSDRRTARSYKIVVDQ